MKWQVGQTRGWAVFHPRPAARFSGTDPRTQQQKPGGHAAQLRRPGEDSTEKRSVLPQRCRDSRALRSKAWALLCAQARQPKKGAHQAWASLTANRAPSPDRAGGECLFVSFGFTAVSVSFSAKTMGPAFRFAASTLTVALNSRRTRMLHCARVTAVRTPSWPGRGCGRAEKGAALLAVRVCPRMQPQCPAGTLLPMPV